MNEYRVKPCVCCSEWSVRSRLRTSIVRFDGVKLYEYITYIFVACPGVRMQAVQSAITFPPVSLSVTLRYCVKVAKHIVKETPSPQIGPLFWFFITIIIRLSYVCHATSTVLLHSTQKNINITQGYLTSPHKQDYCYYLGNSAKQTQLYGQIIRHRIDLLNIVISDNI